MNNKKLFILYKKLIAILIYLSLSILILTQIGTNNIDTITYITLYQLILNILALKYFGFKIFSLPQLFLIFSFIFHCGLLPLYTFKIKVKIPFDVINMVGQTTLIKACWFFIFSQLFLVLGILFTDIFKIKNKTKINIDDMVQKKIVYKTGLYMFLIGIIPRLYIDSMQFLLYSQGNYLSIYELNVSGVFSVIAQFSTIGVMLIIIGKQDEKNIAKIILIMAILYQLINMIKGARQYQVATIICLVYLYINVIKKNKIKLKNVVIIAVLSYIGLVFIDYIGNIRASDTRNYFDFGKALLSGFNGKLLFNTLASFGGTMLSVCYSIISFPYYAKYNFGLSYIESFIPVFIPNVFGILNKFQTSFQFVKAFPLEFQGALGGSYLGELYYNFGFWGCIGTFIIGLVIGKVSKKIKLSIQKKNWMQLGIYIILLPTLIMWVRGYVSDFLRTFIWSVILIFIIYRILYNKYKMHNKLLK